MESRSDELIIRLLKVVGGLEQRIGQLEETLRTLPSAKVTEQIERLDLLLTQLSRHVNPTREENLLLKRTNREMARELEKLSLELGRKLV